MQELLAEAGAELVPFLGRALGAVALALAGAYVELNAMSELLDGDLLLGAWLLYLGTLGLYAGLFVVGPDALAELSDDESPDVERDDDGADEGALADHGEETA